MCTSVHACENFCMHARIYVCMHIRMCVCVYVCEDVCIDMYVYMYESMFVKKKKKWYASINVCMLYNYMCFFLNTVYTHFILYVCMY